MGKHRGTSEKRNERRQVNKQSSSHRQQESPPTVDHDIQAQLERQRRKRTLQSEEAAVQGPPRPVLGGFVYDTEKKAYFPKGSKPEGKRKDPLSISLHSQIGVVAMTRPSVPLNKIPPMWLQHVASISSSPTRGRYLRAQLAGHLYAGALNVQPSSSTGLDSDAWLSLLPPLNHWVSLEQENFAPNVPWDFECRHRLHPSARTFDVQQSPEDETTRLPDIVTLVEGGTLARFSNANAPARAWSEGMHFGTEWQAAASFEPEKDNFMVRFAPRDVVTGYPNLVTASNQASGAIQLVQSRPTFVSRTVINVSCSEFNDVAFPPSGIARVALAPRIGRFTKRITLCCDILTTTAFNMRTVEFSQSDAFCVNFLSEHLILFGHRNGSVSMYDTRRDSVEKVWPQDLDRGPAMSIVPLKNGFTFLAKHMMAGSCQCFDIRALSGSDNYQRALLQDLQLPIETANRMYSSHCSGVAVDPDEAVMIMPFCDNNRRGCFGLWSLLNGHFIGSRAISATAHGDGLPRTELCPTITKTYKLTTSDDGTSRVQCEANTWSLWFKSDEIPTNAFLGSIHQVGFRGSSLSDIRYSSSIFP